MARVLRFEAMDGTMQSFPVPKACSHFLVLKAVQAIHKGGDEAAVMFGLTRAESELVAEIVATLEDHKPKPEAAP